MPFVEQKFNIPDLKGISRKNIEEHVKLYAGYVKHANVVTEKIAELTRTNAETHAYEISELHRRFSFEFNGMRNHEYYFRSLEGGSTSLAASGTLAKAVSQEWGSVDAFLNRFTAIALTRGIGWAMLFYDKTTKRLLTQWVDEQHLGHLATCNIILALDMWEHAYVADYQPSGKKNYVEDFFVNLNWGVIEKNYADALR
jgi:Fe-Mn family superoxide dismutase